MKNKSKYATCLFHINEDGEELCVCAIPYRVLLSSEDHKKILKHWEENGRITLRESEVVDLLKRKGK